MYCNDCSNLIENCTCSFFGGRADRQAPSDPGGYSSEVSEKGPWDVEEWGDGQVVIQSRDFTHDVALKVSGDFRLYEQKMAYAHAICKRLNAWEDE
ncbi:MAG: hypothetical protein KUF79_17195 [Candidatus Thiodiazotropha sp. (ex Ctena orbiculata)]|nr:hypothetical protein [Candidatus Thiodiazotropha taylori]